MSAWYQKTAAETAVELNTHPENGLTPEEAAARLEQHGSNELEERGAKSRWSILWEQFTEVMVVILIIAALVSIFLNEFTNAVVIMLIVVLNAVLGYTQEYRAEQAIAALKQMRPGLNNTAPMNWKNGAQRAAGASCGSSSRKLWW
jgi:Ca2+-transporting ATPase